MDWKVFIKIREYYAGHGDEILGDYPMIGAVYQDVMNLCGFKFSPIEWMLFNDIKVVGIPVVCPQFPVEKYFLDFADPKEKIGFEADSVAFHKDFQKDMERQEHLESLGWTIYRFSSALIYDVDKTLESVRQIQDWHYGEGWLWGARQRKESKMTSLKDVLHQYLSSSKWKNLSKDLKMTS